MYPGTLPRPVIGNRTKLHATATQERRRRRSHAGAWERGKFASRWLLLLALAALSLASPAAESTYACDFKSGNPILFATSIPFAEDAGTRMAAFGNHRGSPGSAGRGGDLYIWYPNGLTRNLTREAGFGVPLANGEEDPANSIAVRDPSVHWQGNRALFSMVVGGYARRGENRPFYWQIYEVTGFCPGETVQITKLNQPESYNNIAPHYASNEQRIIFVSDMPPVGPEARYLYPVLDEENAEPTTSGLWRLNRNTGTVRILTHNPSGAFDPHIDSFGRVIFTRWDHMTRHQQRSEIRTPFFDYNSEREDALTGPVGTFFEEVFPELQADTLRYLKQQGTVGETFADMYGTNDFNQFFPWMIQQDGSGEETLNHVGRHELGGSVLLPSRLDDPSLHNETIRYARNPNTAVLSGRIGFHHLQEDPLHPGRYYGALADSVNANTSGQLVFINAPPGLNADRMQIKFVTAPSTRLPLTNNEPATATMSGLYRQSLPLQTGVLLAVHSPMVRRIKQAEGSRPAYPNSISAYQFRLQLLRKDTDSYYVPETPLVTNPFTKTLAYFLENGIKRTYTGELWELDPIEVKVRPAPPLTTATVDPVESRVIAASGVDIKKLQNYLIQNKLAILVVRNTLLRDGHDQQQPFNLRGPGGGTAITTDCQTITDCKLYDVDQLQIFWAAYLRGKDNRFSLNQPGFVSDQGRRTLARSLDVARYGNSGLVSGLLRDTVKIAADGSVAAFVPAGRALSWQLSNSADPGSPTLGTDAVIRERYWVSFKPGEIRTCPSCHGINTRAQTGAGVPVNEPQALKDLLVAWERRLY